MSENTIQIDSGAITIQVEMDGNPPVSISFNPNDLEFAETLHSLYFDAKEKLVEMNLKKSESAADALDENGMPLEISSLRKEYEEINLWLRAKIDALLGEGTANKIYGDTIYTGEKVDVYLQLLNGLFQVAAPARAKKVAKFVKKK